MHSYSYTFKERTANKHGLLQKKKKPENTTHGKNWQRGIAILMSHNPIGCAWKMKYGGHYANEGWV